MLALVANLYRWATARLALSYVVLAGLAPGCSSAVHKGPPVFIPAPPVPPRLQVLMTFSGEKGLARKGGLSVAFLGKKKDKGIVFRKPYGAVLRGERLYLTDTGAHSVYVVDLRHRSIKRLAGDESMGKVKVPINLTFDEAGTLYVTDTQRRQVLVYDKHERFLRAIGDGKSFTPSGIAVRGDKLIVSDMKKHRILVLDKTTGAKVSEFGGPGVKPGQTAFPANLAVDGVGNIYVSEPITGRVQKFSPTGEFLSTFGRLGKRIGELVRPKGVAVDHEGRVWVVDAASEHAQVFDKKGRLLIFFGGNNNKPGSLYLPSGIFVTRDATTLAVLRPYVDDSFAMEAAVVVVSQYGNQRITILALGKKR